MKTPRMSILPLLALALVCCAQGAPQVHAAADGALLPPECACSMEIIITHEDAAGLKYKLDCMRKGLHRQRVVFTQPRFINGDVAVRSGAVVYFKYAKWHRPELMGTQAGFVESPISWDDILNGAASTGDTLMKADTAYSGTIRIRTLTPLHGAATARQVLHEQIPSGELLEKQFFSPSGGILKTIAFSDRIYEKGALASFTMTIRHHVMNAAATVRIRAIAAGPQPDRHFDPASTGYVRRAPVIPPDTATAQKE